MTCEEFKAFVAQMRLTGLLEMMRVQIKVTTLKPHRDDEGFVEIEMSYLAPDSYMPGDPPRRFTSTQMASAYRFDEHTAARYLRHVLLNLAHHEVDEGIWIDGRCAFDPHRSDPRRLQISTAFTTS